MRAAAEAAVNNEPGPKSGQGEVMRIGEEDHAEQTQPEATRPKLRRFTANDWAAFAGASRGLGGEEPLYGETMLMNEPSAVVVSWPDTLGARFAAGSTVHVYPGDGGSTFWRFEAPTFYVARLVAEEIIPATTGRQLRDLGFELSE